MPSPQHTLVCMLRAPNWKPPQHPSTGLVHELECIHATEYSRAMKMTFPHNTQPR